MGETKKGGIPQREQGEKNSTEYSERGSKIPVHEVYDTIRPPSGPPPGPKPEKPAPQKESE